MIKETSAGVIIFRREDSKVYYLLLKYGWGHWGFVKGHIEKGEKEVDTVIRETQEETGINDLKFVFGFREKIEYDYYMNNKKHHKTVYYYLAETKQKDIKLSFEHKDFAWLPFEQAVKKVTYDNDREVLIKAHKYLKKLGVIKED